MKTAIDLNDLAREIARQRDAKEDYIADTRTLTMTTYPGEEAARAPLATLTLAGVKMATPPSDFAAALDAAIPGLIVQDHAHQQIAARLGIPWRFYQRLLADHPDLLETNVNAFFQREPEKRMIRTLDGYARAFLSDKYRRIDNDDIVERLVPVISDAGGPEVNWRSCAITDTKLYIKATTPRLEGAVKVGDIVCGGVCISNSEVGDGALAIWAFLERLVCMNGMTIPVTFGSDEGKALGLRRYHVGRRITGGDGDGDAYRIFSDATMKLDDDAFFAKAADVVRACFDEERFAEIVSGFSTLAETYVEDNVEAVERITKAHDLSDDEHKTILNHLVEGGDPTVWGIVNAVTRTAEDADSYERASELERLGGLLATQPTQNWAAN